MTPQTTTHAAGDTTSRRLFVFNGGFLAQRRVRRILSLAGYDIRLGLPGPDDLVGVWGQSPTSHRGEAVARRCGTGLLRIEDAFLRSLHPGRAGEPPIGLFLDGRGVHFDPAHPSELETLLATAPLDDTALLDRARDAIARIKASHLSKYSGFDPTCPVPAPGYVLVVDQTRGDASVTASAADANRFREMLVFAQEEHPGAKVLIKGHPETAKGFRPGYFSEADGNDRITLLTDQVSPWTLLEGAVGVYTVSSQMGFEAILAGHRPRVFGQPFYAGWGLTQDEFPVPRRSRNLTRAQLFAAAMILAPHWYDPYADEICGLERVIDILEARTFAWRADRKGWIASGMRLWKRRPLQAVFGQQKKVIFDEAPPTDSPRRRMVWASKATAQHKGALNVEDGFLRSRGLGAELIPPLSLVTDDLGIYYDPTRPSRLEDWIASRATLRKDQTRRAERLISTLTTNNLSKYNLGGARPDLPAGHRVLVPGQVEDDASILTGTGAIHTNALLLQSARQAHPQAVIIYKPHPDVEAGLRKGAINASDIADVIARETDPTALLEHVDEVWTMTSLLGFEALIRNVPVTTLGAPFYAGWGLTTDLGEIPARRTARPSLEGLVHAALIDYPRYFDPVTGTPCPVEVVVDRLAHGDVPHPGPVNRMLAKMQGLLATYAHLWR
ncbi:capsular polysaccharide biosynthesis protein [Thalassococcus sp. S3]|uniref:capsular polysaccharide biosynthesis protein n=1 Tax=Thalassococcus sp. S3 TaxID=2017482 RepID=UPI0010240CE2|nr:capsular polysaccharide biosynthesis protein [Thalassococcus sp. S3]QBF31223.1 beta-3-deoxy-D-manno-oct-2-ulosonic acid transferase [Thalassococcus sp. S3]